MIAATEAVVFEDGQPGSCRIVEERYCFSGELVRWGNGYLFVGFTLPAETPLFAFRGGEAREMFWTPGANTIGDPASSYPGVKVPVNEPESGVVEAVALFMNRDGDPQVHLTIVEEGEVIGYLTADALPVLPQGIQDGAYNLLVWLGDFDLASAVAYQKYFGLTVEP